ncbi:MAG: hypothetical protein V3V00_15780 [Saprospiraceae bacterium]
MGLDITAYRNIKLISQTVTQEEYEKLYWNELSFYSFISNDFKGRAKDIHDKSAYSSDEAYSFGAGSYSGYGRWRKWLCENILGAPPIVIWDNYDHYVENKKPFIELIYFSDCEGIIGTEVSKKLYADFKEYENKIPKSNEHDEHMHTMYMEWLECFRLASNNGCVVFS